MIERTRIVEQTPHFAPCLSAQFLQGSGDLLLCPHAIIELSVCAEQGQGRFDPSYGGFGLHRLVKGALCFPPYGPRPPGCCPGIDTTLFGLCDLCIRFRRFLSPLGRPSPQAADHPLHLPLRMKHI